MAPPNRQTRHVRSATQRRVGRDGSGVFTDIDVEAENIRRLDPLPRTGTGYESIRSSGDLGYDEFMQWAEVKTKVAAGEDAETEFKRGLGDLKGIARTACALANTSGGLVVIGVEDDGTIRGTRENPETTRERLTNLLQDGLNNPVSGALGHATVGDQDGRATSVHWIVIPRQRGFEPLRHGGRVWVRRGRATVEPAPTELQDLYNLFGYVLTEERAIASSGLRDIDIQTFREYMARLGIDLEDDPQPDLIDDLRNRGVLRNIEGEPLVTLYGILCFGLEPQRFPQTGNFRVECVAYAGTDRAAEVMSVADARGRVDTQVRQALGWMKSMGHGERYESDGNGVVLREDVPLVPDQAIREALVNAVAHRDYAIIGSKIFLEVFHDRIDVTSPGTLPNSMTSASARAGGQPRSRNELVANYLLVRRLMEQRGRGWPLMRKAMRKHNGTEPELLNDRDNRFVRVTFRTKPSSTVERE